MGIVLFEVGYKMKKNRDLKNAYESGEPENIQKANSIFDGTTAIKLFLTLL